MSNNSAPAIETFLALADLGEWITAVSGRPIGAPEQMKPHPQSVLWACKALGVEPGEAVLIGDSDFDMQAGRNARTCSIAYAKGSGKADRLTQAGADAVTGSIAELVEQQ